jgi:porin
MPKGGRARGAMFILALAGALAAPAAAQPIDEPKTYAGDVWSRPRLTGDWGGFRDELAVRGVRFDVDLLLTPQGVASGGRDTGVKFWGNADYTLNVDSGKAGLWPGGFLNLYATSSFGESVSGDAGGIMPVNMANIVPQTNEPSTALMTATFTQFLSPKFGLWAGKLFMLNLFQGEFSGNYRTQFLNTAITIPSIAGFVPLSAYTGGAVLLPWPGVTVSALVADPSGTATNNDVTEAFRDGVMAVAFAQAAIKPFGLVGHQKVYYLWSNKERLSLDQDPTNLARLLIRRLLPTFNDPGPVLQRILEQRFPSLLEPIEPLNQKSDTWGVAYTFDQYLWQPAGDPTRGIGVFFTFGASDGNPNPVKYSYAMGIGGKGVVPGRPNDDFGIGWARTQFSSKFVPFLRQQLDLGLDREDAVEMYYNAALTPWLNATADLQIVEPGLKKVLGPNNQLRDMHTAVVAGLRFYVRF